MEQCGRRRSGKPILNYIDVLKQDYGLEADERKEGYGGPSQFENNTRIKQVSKHYRLRELGYPREKIILFRWKGLHEGKGGFQDTKSKLDLMSF